MNFGTMVFFDMKALAAWLKRHKIEMKVFYDGDIYAPATKKWHVELRKRGCMTQVWTDKSLMKAIQKSVTRWTGEQRR